MSSRRERRARRSPEPTDKGEPMAVNEIRVSEQEAMNCHLDLVTLMAVSQ